MLQLAVLLPHVEALSEAHVPRDVERKIRRLIGHVDALRSHIKLLYILSEQAQPSFCVNINEDFCAAQSALKESVFHQMTLSGINRQRSCAPRVYVVHGLGPNRGVPVFLHVALRSKDMPTH
jgi:hypothetical protein